MSSGTLPELAAVHWRTRANHERLTRAGRMWTLCTVAHTVPLIGAAALLVALRPLTAPIAAILLAHAWAINELYAARGAATLRDRRGGSGDSEGRGGSGDSEACALLLLGDLLDGCARDLHSRTGLVIEPGGLGTWVLGEAGAVLVRPGGRRVHCYCVRASDPELPRSDKIAHLLLALREDERGFATVANLVFSGARWRLRRRLGHEAGIALKAALERERARSALGAAALALGPAAPLKTCTPG